MAQSENLLSGYWQGKMCQPIITICPELICLHKYIRFYYVSLLYYYCLLSSIKQIVDMEIN